MAITWTKHWAAGDDGTILRAIDLRNIQNDIDANIGNATSIWSSPIVQPDISVDRMTLYWDNANTRFTYLGFVDLTTDQTIAGIKKFSKVIKTGKGADVASVAGTITLGDDGNVFDITGTNTITGITIKDAGTIVVLQFDGILTLTDGGNLSLKGNLVTQAGDAIILYSDGTNWNEVSRSNVSLPYLTGSTQLSALDTVRSFTGSTSYRNSKSFILPRSGVLSISFDLAWTSTVGNVYGRIYRNGSAVGTERTVPDVASDVYSTFTEDISGWAVGDLCQLYVKSDTSTSVVGKVKNFRLSASIPTVETMVTDTALT